MASIPRLPRSADQALPLIQAAVSTFKDVEQAVVGVDADGHLVLEVRMKQPQADGKAKAPQSEMEALSGLLDRDVAPMVVFDIETLHIIKISSSAAQLLGVDNTDVSALTLADLYSQDELDRLGRELAASKGGWIDMGSWVMRAPGGTTRHGVRNWHGPAVMTHQRLLIASAND